MERGRGQPLQDIPICSIPRPLPHLLHSTAQSSPCPHLAGCPWPLPGASAFIPPSSTHPTKGGREDFGQQHGILFPLLYAQQSPIGFLMASSPEGPPWLPQARLSSGSLSTFDHSSLSHSHCVTRTRHIGRHTPAHRSWQTPLNYQGSLPHRAQCGLRVTAF